MTRKRMRAHLVRSALAIFLLLAPAYARSTQMQQRMPGTQDDPLEDRIKSGERVDRDSWQKPNEVVRADEGRLRAAAQRASHQAAASSRKTTTEVRLHRREEGPLPDPDPLPCSASIGGVASVHL
jgi:hypothetical protein